MARRLLILRHAKSSWAVGDETDFDRPLNERGKQDAKRLGRWIKSEVNRPELILASPARRVKQTLKRVCKKADWPMDLIQWDQDLYLAGLKTLCDELEKALRNHLQVMVVGHNPGLEELLKMLCGTDLPYTKDGKLLTTGNLAEVELPDDCSTITANCGQLLRLVRPSDLVKR